ncbi:hypothetical protein KY285_024266 [Solanum tuberosum]|nr:hypothetical protein KY285_024266 [Solanum tuberosum]
MEHALKFSFLKEVQLDDCLEMKAFVQQGIYVSTPSLESVNNDDEVKEDDLNNGHDRGSLLTFVLYN